MACLFALGNSKEVVLVGDLGSQEIQEMINVLRAHYLPHTVVLVKQQEDQLLPKLAPFITDHKLIQYKATAYICENFSCQAPTNDIEALRNL